MPKQTNEEKLKEVQSTLREVQLEREALRGECAALREMLDASKKSTEKYRQTSRRLAIAFIKVRHAISDSMAGLLIENLNPGIDISSTLLIEEEKV